MPAVNPNAFMQFIIHSAGLIWMYYKSMEMHPVIMEISLCRFSILDLIMVFCVTSITFATLRHNVLKLFALATMISLVYCEVVIMLNAVGYVLQCDTCSFVDAFALTFNGVYLEMAPFVLTIPLICAMVVGAQHWVVWLQENNCAIVNGRALIIERHNHRKHGRKCVICFRKLRGRVAGVHTDHVHYHVECLEQWLGYGKCCPNCRFEPGQTV